MSFWSLLLFRKTVTLKHSADPDTCVQNLKRFIDSFDERYFVILTSNPYNFTLSVRSQNHKSPMLKHDYGIGLIQVKETGIIADFSKGNDAVYAILGAGIIFELLFFMAWRFFNNPGMIYPIIAIPVFYFILVLLFMMQVKDATDWLKWNIIKAPGEKQA